MQLSQGFALICASVQICVSSELEKELDGAGGENRPLLAVRPGRPQAGRCQKPTEGRGRMARDGAEAGDRASERRVGVAGEARRGGRREATPNKAAFYLCWCQVLRTLRFRDVHSSPARPAPGPWPPPCAGHAQHTPHTAGRRTRGRPGQERRRRAAGGRRPAERSPQPAARARQSSDGTSYTRLTSEAPVLLRADMF